MLEMVAAEVPVFLSVTERAAEVEPTAVDGKVRLVGVKVSVEAELVVGHAFTKLFTLMEPNPVA
jgi:hypothetical protein